ncbi:amidohydrolase family protein [Marinilabiliaceae bacterium ANBcel2]|nr:amidohydrolase family protein [Marinilabiliaceae bacterium ANBcel2]
MKYCILKNGKVVTEKGIVKKDILIGNGKILEVGNNIKISYPSVKKQNLQGFYILPGLIHYNCPFLRRNTAKASSSVYDSISQGATCLFDTLRAKGLSDTAVFKQLPLFNNAIPAGSYALHLSAETCNNMKYQMFKKLVIMHGLSSCALRWKTIEKFIKGKFKKVAARSAEMDMLILCKTEAIKDAGMIENYTYFKSYLKKLTAIIEQVRKYNTTILFSGITTKDEVTTILNSKYSKVYIAVTIPENETKSTTILNKNDIFDRLYKNPAILLSPPQLSQEENSFLNLLNNCNQKSFLTKYITYKNINEQQLIKVCDMYATRMAKLLGLYPGKGLIAPGADADFIVWDPSLTHKPTTSSLLRQDIHSLILNGTVVLKDNLVLPEDISGRYYFRNYSN